MSGTIRTYQKCPGCGAPFPSSNGDFPIICESCKTQPTKYFIAYWWKKPEFAYHDRDGRTIHYWHDAKILLGEIQSGKKSHKLGKGFFDPSIYKRQSSTSFQAFWERFLEGYSGSSPSTRDKIKAIGQHHLTYFADFQMRDIVPWHVDEWWRELQKKGLTPRYYNEMQTWLRSFFKNALKLKVITEDITLNFPDLLDTPDPEVDEWLTEEEQLAVLGALPEYDRPIYDFLFLTGVRVNEACALQRSDINYKKGVIAIQNTVKRDGSVGIVKNKRNRRIPLKAVVGCFNAGILSLSGFVFINKWGRRYSDGYLRNTFYKTCGNCGIKPVKLKNATRHSFGMGLLRKGYDIWQVSKIMGHSDIKITEHYAKMVDKEISGAYGRNYERKTNNIQNRNG